MGLGPLAHMGLQVIQLALQPAPVGDWVLDCASANSAAASRVTRSTSTACAAAAARAASFAAARRLPAAATSVTAPRTRAWLPRAACLQLLNLSRMRCSSCGCCCLARDELLRYGCCCAALARTLHRLDEKLCKAVVQASDLRCTSLCFALSSCRDLLQLCLQTSHISVSLECSRNGLTYEYCKRLRAINHFDKETHLPLRSKGLESRSYANSVVQFGSRRNYVFDGALDYPRAVVN